MTDRGQATTDRGPATATPHPGEGVVAVVPLRDGTSGKSRLAGLLDPNARRRLVALLAERVLVVLAATPGVDRVVVVTADPSFAADVARRAGAQRTAGERTAGQAEERTGGQAGNGVGDRAGDHTGDAARRTGRAMATAESAVPGAPVEILHQPADRPGLNAALDVARETLRERSPSARMLVVHADLPALTVADVQALLGPDAAVVLGADRAGSGTNALALDASAPFTFRFGASSLAAHRREADERGLDVSVVDRPGTSLDLDTASDWEQLPADVRGRLGGRIREA